MIRKEILDTLKQAGSIASLGLLIPLVYLVNGIRLEANPDFIHYLDWGLTYLLPVFVLYTSWCMFSSEDREGSWDYMKSLPLSRWRLFLTKVLPRLMVTLPVIHWAVIRNHWVWFFNPYGRTVAYLYLTVLIIASGFFLGITDRKNPAVILMFSLPVLFLAANLEGSDLSRKVLYLFYRKVMEPAGSVNETLFFSFSHFSYFLFTLLPAVLPILVLIPLYRDWNSSCKHERTLRTAKRMTIPLLVLLAIQLIW